MAIFNVDNYEGITTYFEEHLYVFHYDGLIRQRIIEYKFGDKSYLYKTFLNFIKKNENFCVQIKKYDIITSVPISKKRFKERGYNQSSIIGRFLAKELEINYIDKLLIKKINNLPQSLLKREDREQNVKNVYEFNPKKKKIKSKLINNKKILIVDDIFTTGNTVNECAKVLKEKNVKKVGVLTIAKD